MLSNLFVDGAAFVRYRHCRRLRYVVHRPSSAGAVRCCRCPSSSMSLSVVRRPAYVVVVVRRLAFVIRCSSPVARRISPVAHRPSSVLRGSPVVRRLSPLSVRPAVRPVFVVRLLFVRPVVSVAVVVIVTCRSAPSSSPSSVRRSRPF